MDDSIYTSLFCAFKIIIDSIIYIDDLANLWIMRLNNKLERERESEREREEVNIELNYMYIHR